MENTLYSHTKLIEYAEAFRRLEEIYQGSSSNALALQLREIAVMLERISESGIRAGKYKELKKSLFKFLKGKGILVEQILITEQSANHFQLIMDMHMVRKGCVISKDIASAISVFLGREFVPAKGSRQVVTDELAEFVFEEATKYRLVFGSAGCNKGFSNVSGDNYSFIDIEGGKTVISLADGMGCGAVASHESGKMLEMLEQLLEAGFSENCAVNMVNSVFAANEGIESPVTIDVCSFNGYEGVAEFIKMGAAASFIKSRDGVRVINSDSLPAGVIESAVEVTESIALDDGDYIIMLSDGVLDALPFYDKEKQMSEIIEGIEDRIPVKVAESILNEVLFYSNKVSDDMTILVTGVWKR